MLWLTAATFLEQATGEQMNLKITSTQKLKILSSDVFSKNALFGHSGHLNKTNFLFFSYFVFLKFYLVFTDSPLKKNIFKHYFPNIQTLLSQNKQYSDTTSKIQTANTAFLFVLPLNNTHMAMVSGAWVYHFGKQSQLTASRPVGFIRGATNLELNLKLRVNDKKVIKPVICLLNATMLHRI